ncbi:hypothetical protein OG963_01955 [Streptomyces sp. NBC_01707]|jgi:hypothetical protein|uniref:hypothetical protein n=1 Tax=unclassified Streptomyces TaxID=2593676 RepID=UPI00099D620C|nr:MULTISPECIES: hypothetical protein [unclassified Streptomyces]MDX3771927.1 hypothetical protein [Streptomyces sp. AK08-01B]MDX3821549.1 hypothetical protein [Streptomyces sp. AK08-01A]
MSWSVWTEEIPAQTVLDMPADLRRRTANFLRALAIEVAGALDLGRRPPGDPMDDIAVRYSLEVPGEPVIIEYMIMRDAKEIRVPVLVWFH